jgi:hypothetical protein
MNERDTRWKRELGSVWMWPVVEGAGVYRDDKTEFSRQNREDSHEWVILCGCKWKPKPLVSN